MSTVPGFHRAQLMPTMFVLARATRLEKERLFKTLRHGRLSIFHGPGPAPDIDENGWTGVMITTIMPFDTRGDKATCSPPGRDGTAARRALPPTASDTDFPGEQGSGGRCRGFALARTRQKLVIVRHRGARHAGRAPPSLRPRRASKPPVPPPGGFTFGRLRKVPITTVKLTRGH